MGTISFGSIYPGSQSTQQGVNPGYSRGTAKVPTRPDFNVPVLPGVAGYLGISVPVLLALGVIGWFLIERYD